jgi:hypothetical protein
VGADVRPDAAEPMRKQENLCVRSRMCECGLPEQERRNCRSEFEGYPGHGRFHVRAGRNESHPAVGTAALMDRTRATLYLPWT